MDINKYYRTLLWIFTKSNQRVEFEQRLDQFKVKWKKKYASIIKAHYQRHKGETCVILCNGPSLNKVDFNLIGPDIITFGLNKIHLIQETKPIKLDYLVAIDPRIIEQFTDFLVDNTTLSKFIGINHLSKEIQEELLSNSTIIPLWSERKFGFSSNIAQQVFEGSTVTYVALQIAYYMGFNNVILVGCDHNFGQDVSDLTSTKVGNHPNYHFHERYFEPDFIFTPDLEGSEIAYRMAKIAFYNRGGKVINATPDTKLTVFPVTDLASALKELRN